MYDFSVVEQKWQKKWEDAKAFEADPDPEKNKFFMTTPYPYISGSLHIGHARVVTEADVFSRFQRMLGKNVLYPMAFHISGTPVLGISLAIKNGEKDKIGLYKGYVSKYIKDKKEVDKVVKSFEDPQNIVDFFIPKMKEEFKTLGIAVDWRRSYTSGDIEHQALVEWQFRRYKEKKYLVQGKYPILFSKTLNNAVGEDDIKDGDTDPVEIQNFTLIKFKFDKSYLIAGTLRPETMYGQTNMWVNPDIDYVVADVDGEEWIISKECADKLSFQDKKMKIKGKVHGSEMLGKHCFAPFIEKDIIILPSAHCNPKIGTGIVTSVPGDAPFDYIALKELQESASLCEKYKLDHDEIKSIKLIPIIKSKGYGDFPAVEICKKLNITSLKQHDLIAAATQEIYKVGFHTGIMRKECGPYAGMKVIEAKEKMKADLISQSRASLFYETSREAQSRDGGEVIVAVLDGQWFLDFNAKGWKHDAKRSLSDIELWPEKYRKQFEDVFDWLDKRPCARKRGLGTKLPFDKEWVIESLSDSTVYMALYPIIHIIRKNNLKKEQLNEDFFNYVMNSVGDITSVSASTKIDKKVLEQMNHEWHYWYPFDQRHTFTAHLSNHLSFMIFAHTACFKEEFWPKRISFHGMIISEGEKMSKSKGNVITLLDINEKYGADAFRAFMCNSTSVESAFNWESDKVMVMKKHLASLHTLLEEMQKNKDKDFSSIYKDYPSFVSKSEKAIKKAKAALEVMNLREYSNIILYEMLNNYRTVQKTLKHPDDIKSINSYISHRWIKMLSPLTPHLADELWSIDQKSFASLELWPDFDGSLIKEEAEYEDDLLHNTISDIKTVLDLAKINEPKSIRIFLANQWKYDFFRLLKEKLTETRDFKLLLNYIMASDLKQHSKEITKILPVILKNPQKMPEVITNVQHEHDTLLKFKDFIEKQFRSVVELVNADNTEEMKAKQALPGKVAIIVE